MLSCHSLIHNYTNSHHNHSTLLLSLSLTISPHNCTAIIRQSSPNAWLRGTPLNTGLKVPPRGCSTPQGSRGGLEPTLLGKPNPARGLQWVRARTACTVAYYSGARAGASDREESRGPGGSVFVDFFERAGSYPLKRQELEELGSETCSTGRDFHSFGK